MLLITRGCSRRQGDDQGQNETQILDCHRAAHLRRTAVHSAAAVMRTVLAVGLLLERPTCAG